MGLYVNHLRTVNFEIDRTLYIYLLDFGWPEGNWEQIFKRHFIKMADLASKAGAVVIGSPNGIHFANEVLSFHKVGHLDADEVLPGLLITKTPPHHFESNQMDSEDFLVISLAQFCITEHEFVRAIEGVFHDLDRGYELENFRIAQHDILRQQNTNLAGRFGSAIELKPGAFGIKLDLKKLLFR